MKATTFGALCGARVLVVGDVMLDRYIWGTVGRVSPEAPVQVVLASQKTAVAGGAANVACNLRGLTALPVLVGIRGGDESGILLEELLTRIGAEHYLLIDGERPTSTKTRILAQGQQLLRLDEEVSRPLPRALEEQIIETVRGLMDDTASIVLSDYGKGVLSEKVCRSVIEAAQEKAIPVLVDPKGTDWSRYGGAACVTPNTREFFAVVARDVDTEQELICEAELVRQRFAFERLLITRGEKGMTLVEPKAPGTSIASRAREVFDVSGAGDTVIATLAAAVAARFGWPEAAQIANTAAGVVVGKLGTQPIQLEELADELERETWSTSHQHADIRKAKRLVQTWRERGEKIAFTNGCFDILHAGHIKLLEAASRKGARLVVGLNSDASVRRLKGEARPVLPQDERATLLSALPHVDLVVVFEDDTPLALIDELRPDILVKGADCRMDEVVGRELVESYGGEVSLIGLEPGLSTTEILRKVALL